MKSRSTSLRIAAATLCLSLGLLLGAALACLDGYQRASRALPRPASEAVQDEDGFPEVDWAYWQGVNPDVIGWISIPGTQVNYPVVQAPPSDPQYYLEHDVYGRWNYLGCPYLDAACAEGGLEHSPNAVLFAHNLGFGDTSMFAQVASYLDAGFADDHSLVLLQTPSAKMRFTVKAACCIRGNEAAKRTAFENQAQLEEWFGEVLKSCSLRRAPYSLEQGRILSLCTCSYNYWDDERTIAFALPCP